MNIASNFEWLKPKISNRARQMFGNCFKDHVTQSPDCQLEGWPLFFENLSSWVLDLPWSYQVDWLCRGFEMLRSMLNCFYLVCITSKKIQLQLTPQLRARWNVFFFFNSWWYTFTTQKKLSVICIAKKHIFATQKNWL